MDYIVKTSQTKRHFINLGNNNLTNIIKAT